MSSTPVPGIKQQRLAHAKSFFFEDEQILVDTGSESERDEFRAFIQDLPGIETLVLSHSHGDHVGNVETVLAETDPEVVVPENEPGLAESLPRVDRQIADGEVVAGDVVVREVAGHTEGIVGLHDESSEAFVATDILDGSDRRGLPPGYLLPPPAMFNWNHRQAEENLEDLLSFDFSAILVTHGSNVLESPMEVLQRYVNFREHFRANV